MARGQWLNGAIPGDGSLRPGSNPNYPDYPNYSNYPN